jgi:hypothetical protein
MTLEFAADKCEDITNVIECVTNVQLLNVIVIVTLAFGFMNRWHDAASSIATIVSTRVLRPLWAVAWGESNLDHSDHCGASALLLTARKVNASESGRPA